MSRIGDLIVLLVIVFVFSDPKGVVTSASPMLSGAVRQAERAAGLDTLQLQIRRMLPY